ncbi:hypothetical protein KIPB_008703, partial [Kipferlia bialata]
THVACLRLVPSHNPFDPQSTKPPSLPKRCSVDGTCSVCKEKEGHIICCAAFGKVCNIKFHPMCGLLQGWKVYTLDQNDTDVLCPMCAKHSKVDWDKWCTSHTPKVNLGPMERKKTQRERERERERQKEREKETRRAERKERARIKAQQRIERRGKERERERESDMSPGSPRHSMERKRDKSRSASVAKGKSRHGAPMSPLPKRGVPHPLRSERGATRTARLMSLPAGATVFPVSDTELKRILASRDEAIKASLVPAPRLVATTLKGDQWGVICQGTVLLPRDAAFSPVTGTEPLNRATFERLCIHPGVDRIGTLLPLPPVSLPPCLGYGAPDRRQARETMSYKDRSEEWVGVVAEVGESLVLIMGGGTEELGLGSPLLMCLDKGGALPVLAVRAPVEPDYRLYRAVCPEKERERARERERQEQMAAEREREREYQEQTLSAIRLANPDGEAEVDAMEVEIDAEGSD